MRPGQSVSGAILNDALEIASENPVVSVSCCAFALPALLLWRTLDRRHQLISRPRLSRLSRTERHGTWTCEIILVELCSRQRLSSRIRALLYFLDHLTIGSAWNVLRPEPAFPEGLQSYKFPRSSPPI